MTEERIFGLICAAAALAAMFELIRRQNVKEKYLVLWLCAAIGIGVIAVYPKVVDALADVTGIQQGPNVILLVGGLVVTLVCVQLSVEVSRLEDRSRALAEEIGLLQLQVAKGGGTVDGPHPGHDYSESGSGPHGTRATTHDSL